MSYFENVANMICMYRGLSYGDLTQLRYNVCASKHWCVITVFPCCHLFRYHRLPLLRRLWRQERTARTAANFFTPRIRNPSGWKQKFRVLGKTLFQFSLVHVFESLTPERQIETLRASRSSSTSDNLHLVLALTCT
jgi:hypothetical protein